METIKNIGLSLKDYATSRLLRINVLIVTLCSFLPDSLNPQSLIAGASVRERFERLTGTSSLFVVGIIGLLLLASPPLLVKFRASRQRYRRTLLTGSPPFAIWDSVLWGALLTIALSVTRFAMSSSAFVWMSVAVVAGCFLVFHARRSRAPKVRPGFLLSDNPIDSSADDLLGRGEFVDALYQQIESLELTDSIVFGLTGRWGEGKTSVINILRQKLNTDERFVIVNFDPWYYKDEDVIVKAFYSELERTLKNTFLISGLKKVVAKYLKRISPEVGPFGLKLNLPFEEESLEALKRRLDTSIRRIQRKVIIIIDDIDRLEPREMLQVFKLARLTGMFPNTLFLLCYDETVVASHLEQIKIDKEFLSKIVQKSISLPAIDQSTLNEFTLARIDKYLREIGISDEGMAGFTRDFAHIYRSQISRLITTLRDCKRYLNSLLTGIARLKGEIDLFDYAVLEVLRLHFEEVYKDIWKNPYHYIKPDDEIYFSSPVLPLDEGERRKLATEHIEALTQNKAHREGLHKLLSSIFVEAAQALRSRSSDRQNITEAQEGKRIRHPRAFRTYFQMKVPPSKLSYAFVENALATWRSTPAVGVALRIQETLLQAKLQGKLFHFFEALLFQYVGEIDANLAVPLMEAIWKKSDIYSGGDPSPEWYEFRIQFWTEFGRALHLMMKLADLHSDCTQLQQIFDDAISKSPYIGFSASLLNKCSLASEDRYINVKTAIDLERLRSLMLARMKREFFEQEKNIFEIPDDQDRGLMLYQWSFLAARNQSDKPMLNGYMLSILEDTPHDFATFIRHQERERRNHFNISEFSATFGLDEFAFLAQRHMKCNELSNDERSLIQAFAAAVAEYKAGRQHPTS